VIGITLLKGGKKGEYYAIRSGILNMTLARQTRVGIQSAGGALRAHDYIICADFMVIGVPALDGTS
jgi:hypothetical protein